jgi:hypothetical protein
MNQSDFTFSQSQLKPLQRNSLIAGGVGLLLSVGGLLVNSAQFWQSYLLAYTFWLEVALGCLGLLMLHHVVGGRWSAAIRRVMEIGAQTLPLLAILFIPLLLGLKTLYPWAQVDHMAESELLQNKALYLNVPFFLARAAVYWLLWLGLSWFLTRWSRAQDQTGAPNLAIRMRRLSTLGLILLVLSSTFAAYDWLMSLEPEWFSSIYGLLFIAGQGVAALALAIIGLRFISQQPAAAIIIESTAQTNIFNDLGNFLLGFVIIWAYFAFSQFLIIWSANIPEEAIWYVHRSQGGWQWVGMGLIGAHFVVPFFLLLSRQVKRQIRLLTGLALLLFLVRFIDLYWLIVPAFYPAGLHWHWLDLTAFIGIGGGWLAIFWRQLAGQPYLALQDPHLQEEGSHERHQASTVSS